MRKRLGVVIAAAAATLVVASAPANAITHGQPDAGAHPAVGELLFFVPDEPDSRFNDSGAWFTCTGTLLSDTVVLTAGHCTYAIGKDGASTTAGGGNGAGGDDVWIDFNDAPDFSILPPSSSYGRDQNPQRYHDWAAALDASSEWHRATSHPHPQFDPNQFFLHDAGVIVLDTPVSATQHGRISPAGFLDQFQTAPSNKQRFTVVGYGLNKELPHTDFGGDVRFAGTTKLVTLNGTFGVEQGTIARFSNDNGKTHQGGTCFGDSGGPTFVEGTTQIVAVTSFGLSPNCTGTDDEYRIDQSDDLAFLAGFGITP
jgi:hypothetical protein